MDTPFSNLSTEEFDALVSTHSAHQPLGQDKPLSANLTQALAWGLELAPQVMTNLISRAVQSMDRKTISLAGTPQEQTLEAAAAALDAQRARWVKQYPALLRVAMAYPSPAKMATLLPLVDLRICAQEVALLDELVKSQGGLLNPLSPQAYVQALLEQIARSDAEPEFRQIWADHLLAALSSQLAWVYLQLHAVLRDPSQRDASAIGLADDFQAYAGQAYGFSSAYQQTPADDTERPSNAETLALADQARRTVHKLRQHLGLAAQPAQDLDQALQADPMQALLYDLDLAEKLMSQIHELGLPMPDLDEDLDASLEHKSVSAPASARAALGSGGMEEQISALIQTYQNTTTPGLQRIPTQLRDELEKLKNSLLILVREGDDVISNEAHPARQFLNLICKRSLEYSSDAAEDYSSFIEPVQKLISSISGMQYVNGRVFEKASDKLVTYWKSQDEKAASKQALAAQEEERMVAVKQLAGRLSFELVGRKDAGDAPPLIKQFLMGPWAQVLARAKLFPSDSADHQRYTQAMAGLLWSVSVRRAAPRKNEHILLLDQLNMQLQVGLQSIHMPDSQIQDLLADISKLQEAVQASAVKPGTDTSVSDPAPLLL